MHRVVLIVVIVFLIVLFIGCLDMQIHTRPRASSFVPEEVHIDCIPENPHEVVAVQHPPGGVCGGGVVVVIQRDDGAIGAQAGDSDR